MAQQTAVEARMGSHVEQLAQFFPAATPVRIPVHVEGAGIDAAEETVIEFGTPTEVLFASTFPREFGERLSLRNSDGSFATEAYIVGMQFHSGRVAVAARFAAPVRNWIVKP